MLWRVRLRLDFRARGSSCWGESLSRVLIRISWSILAVKYVASVVAVVAGLFSGIVCGFITGELGICILLGLVAGASLGIIIKVTLARSGADEPFGRL